MGAPVLTSIEARGIRATLDESLGQLADFAVRLDGDWHRPLSRVPWADTPPDCSAIESAPHLARMSGDFFCAPFAAADVEPAPPHGWPANSRWRLMARETLQDGMAASWVLERKVMGAMVTKHWRLHDDDPFLYQEHRLEGGAGRISLAHHVMIDVRDGAELLLSPRAHAETPALTGGMAAEFPGASLAYPARSADLKRFPGAKGSVDLLRYPLAERNEDFVMLVDAVPAPSAETVGWAGVFRPIAGDCVVLVKPAHLLPQTMLWFSNGARSAPPWSGRHVGVLGVEDACAYSLHGHAASIAPNALSECGVPTSHALVGALRIAYAIGVLKTPIGPPPHQETDAIAQRVAQRGGLVAATAMTPD
jgi:hypothetical protein